MRSGEAPLLTSLQQDTDRGWRSEPVTRHGVRTRDTARRGVRTRDTARCGFALIWFALRCVTVHGVAWCGVASQDTAWCGMVWRGVALCGMMLRCIVLCGGVRVHACIHAYHLHACMYYLGKVHTCMHAYMYANLCRRRRRLAKEAARMHARVRRMHQALLALIRAKGLCPPPPCSREWLCFAAREAAVRYSSTCLLASVLPAPVRFG